MKKLNPPKKFKKKYSESDSLQSLQVVYFGIATKALEESGIDPTQQNILAFRSSLLKNSKNPKLQQLGNRAKFNRSRAGSLQVGSIAPLDVWLAQIDDDHTIQLSQIYDPSSDRPLVILAGSYT